MNDKICYNFGLVQLRPKSRAATPKAGRGKRRLQVTFATRGPFTPSPKEKAAQSVGVSSRIKILEGLVKENCPKEKPDQEDKIWNLGTNDLQRPYRSNKDHALHPDKFSPCKNCHKRD